MENIEQFKEEVEKLNKLLNADEQGLGTWWNMLDNRVKSLFKMYYGYEPSAIKPK